jgi:two-component system, chemotaxis family, chemotaxis protein CheY
MTPTTVPGPQRGGSAASTASTLLVVDDDPEVRAALASTLGAEGYIIHTAANGVEALSILDQGVSPCLLVVDLMMPVMDGWALVGELRRDRRHAELPVVVISAGGTAMLATAPVASGYLTKPLDLESLLAMIHRCRRHDSWEPKGARRAAVTAPIMVTPAVLLVGYDPRFRARCERLGLEEVHLIHTSVVNAATSAARWRPLSIVLAEDLYAFDPEGFDLLARDVKAALARIADEGVSDAELDRLMRAAIADGRRRRAAADDERS